MIAKIKLWGNEYKALAVWWNEDGSVAHVVIDDEGKTKTIFQKSHDSEINAEENRYTSEHLHADLNKIIIWEEF